MYAARDVLNEFTAANPGYAFYLAGGATLDIDGANCNVVWLANPALCSPIACCAAMDKVNELFPIMIATTVGVVFLVVAVIFKSVFVPIRLLVTIALGICWCARSLAFAGLLRALLINGIEYFTAGCTAWRT